MRNQIDYISINKRFRSSVRQLKSMPGVDLGAGCDHVPVVAEIEVRVKKVKNNKKIRRDWNILRRN